MLDVARWKTQRLVFSRRMAWAVLMFCPNETLQVYLKRLFQSSKETRLYRDIYTDLFPPPPIAWQWTNTCLSSRVPGRPGYSRDMQLFQLNRLRIACIPPPRPSDAAARLLPVCFASGVNTAFSVAVPFIPVCPINLLNTLWSCFVTGQ